MKYTIEQLETRALELVAATKTGSTSINNKTILVELLKDKQHDRKQLPVLATVKYYKMNNIVEIDEDDFEAKKVSMTNSLDTLISNYNDRSKIGRDDLLKGTFLNKEGNSYQILSFDDVVTDVKTKK